MYHNHRYTTKKQNQFAVQRLKKKKRKKKEDKCYDTASTRIKNMEEIFQAAYHVGKIPQLYTRLPQENVYTEGNFLYKLPTLHCCSEHSLDRLSQPTNQIT